MKRFLLALIKFLVIKAVGPTKLNGSEFSINVTYKNRYLSPFYWILAVLLIIPFIFDGGLIEWAKLMFSTASDRYITGGKFHANVSWLRKKYTLWLMIYGYQ